MFLSDFQLTVVIKFSLVLYMLSSTFVKVKFVQAVIQLEKLEGASSRFVHLVKFSMKFSNSSFVILVHLLHP